MNNVQRLLMAFIVFDVAYAGATFTFAVVNLIMRHWR